MSPPAAPESIPHLSVRLVYGDIQVLAVKPTLAVKSPELLVIVTDVALAGLLLNAANVPLFVGVVWLAPVTVITPKSALALPVQETVAVCDPDGGLMSWKINVRLEAVVPESVPGINVPTTPPKVAVMLVAVFVVMATMIIAARLEPLPMMNAGVVILVTPKEKSEVTLLSNATMDGATVLTTSVTVAVCVRAPLVPVIVRG